MVLGECVRVLFLLTAMLWDRCVEQEGGTNLRPMNCIAPLKPMFAYCGFEGMADWPVADVLAELSKRRDEAMQWNDVQNPKQDVKTRRRWLGWIDRGLGMGIVALAVLPGCDRRAGNEVKRELWAPDGSRRLVVFCRTVDATTGFNTQVSMLGPGELLPDDGGNAFIADDGDVRVSWKADGGILIDYPGDLRVFKQEAVVGGVAVEYRKRP
ncbi:hypothetical protein llg_25560 [Luteolibacter sp. LG18]|nr:hypothetical protein llg_25560 [Luteolibacter sp. LG18]